MQAPLIDRRHFLGSAGATAAFFAMQAPSTGRHSRRARPPPRRPADSARPRLLSLELLAGASMSDMKAFYGKTLDLGIRDEHPDRFTVEAGETRITFLNGADTVTGGRRSTISPSTSRRTRF